MVLILSSGAFVDATIEGKPLNTKPFSRESPNVIDLNNKLLKYSAAK